MGQQQLFIYSCILYPSYLSSAYVHFMIFIEFRILECPFFVFLPWLIVSKLSKLIVQVF